MKFTVHQVSRRGGRDINEDRLGYTYTREAVLLVLADGMGGHPEGEKAAELAVKLFTQRFVALAKPALADVVAFLVDTLNAANQAIVDYANAHAMPDNPRTTLVAAVLQGGQLYGIHSGDSRLYWSRQGGLVARTRDHSYQEQAARFKGGVAPVNRSVLFTCLGSPQPPIYDLLGPQPLQQGDRLLLCSDGLWGVVPDDTVVADLGDGALKTAVLRLAELALQRGGRHGDNVSILGLEWETPNAFEPTQVIETQALAGDFASTLQSLDPLEQQALADFDDAAIERSIAEINEAIRRTAVRKNPS